MAPSHPDNFSPSAGQCVLPHYKTSQEQPDTRALSWTWPQRDPNLIELHGAFRGGLGYH